jgi:hypothetical protein
VTLDTLNGTSFSEEEKEEEEEGGGGGGGGGGGLHQFQIFF